MRCSISPTPMSSLVRLQLLRKALKLRASTLSCVCAGRVEFRRSTDFRFPHARLCAGHSRLWSWRKESCGWPGDLRPRRRELLYLLVRVSPPQPFLTDVTVKAFATELAPGSITGFEGAEYTGL